MSNLRIKINDLKSKCGLIIDIYALWEFTSLFHQTCIQVDLSIFYFAISGLNNVSSLNINNFHFLVVVEFHRMEHYLSVLVREKFGNIH